MSPYIICAICTITAIMVAELVFLVKRLIDKRNTIVRKQNIYNESSRCNKDTMTYMTEELSLIVAGCVALSNIDVAVSIYAEQHDLLVLRSPLKIRVTTRSGLALLDIPMPPSETKK